MSSKRILDRCSTATFKEVVKVEGYKFSFNKKSTDGSGKGNMTLSKSKTDFVLGVVFEIEESQRKTLEDAEGLGNGYEEIKLDLTNEAGKKLECIAYVATEAKFINDKLVPYDWYKEHCLIGAREYNLPDEYVEMIESIACKVDTDNARAEKERNIYN
jgi:cation transport regulator ChaC